MERVLIVGCSGGGKSTLARALGAQLGWPVTHLDALMWRPGWEPVSPEQARPTLQALTVPDRWIIDGGYGPTLADRLARADTVVWIDQPRWLCLWRVAWRSLKGWGRTRPDAAPGCPERFSLTLFRYIWNYRRDAIPQLRERLTRHGGHTRLIRLCSDREIAAFLADPASARTFGT